MKYNVQFIEKPDTLSEQIIVLLNLLPIFADSRIVDTDSVIDLILDATLQINYSENFKTIRLLIPALREKSEQLIICSDLMPQLRACLWILYWYSHEPTASLITTFLDESRTWLGNQVLTTFLQNHLRGCWPIIALALEKQMNSDLHAVALLQPYLNTSQEISISQQVVKTFQKELNKLSNEEQIATVLSHYLVNNYLDLIPIAENLGVNISKLLDMYTSISVVVGQKLSSTMLQRVFSDIEDDFVQYQKPLYKLWPLVTYEWNLNHEATRQGIQLLHTLTERLSQQLDLLDECIILFLKLLSFDATLLIVAPVILSALTNKISWGNYSILYYLTKILSDIPPEPLAVLANFTTHEDIKVQQGAIILWSKLLEMGFNRQPIGRSLPLPLSLSLPLNFNLNLCLSLIKSTDVIQRKKGIILLTYSHFPISKEKHNAELRELMAQAHESDEIGAWTLFLRNIPISKAERKDWLKLLETILASPQIYTTRILTATMERYTNLIGEAKPEIKDKHALGLPALALSKKKRTRK